MNKEEIKELEEVKLTVKENNRRLNELERKIEDIHELTSSVKVLATEMKRMREDQVKMDSRIKTLEDKPSKKMDQIWGYIVSAIIGGMIGFVFVKLGLK